MSVIIKKDNDLNMGLKIMHYIVDEISDIEKLPTLDTKFENRLDERPQKSSTCLVLNNGNTKLYILTKNGWKEMI